MSSAHNPRSEQEHAEPPYREFALVVYRSLMAICAGLAKLYGFGKERNRSEDGG